ncbi:cryptochrome/photolyase family protein [Thalassobacillus hwangdonensis]|uniref:Cryptochrome/photolyase family protein n=1 Tax=Thalassobacillus hwangdonensis TaxID=546108 RepID=A0ABW3L600_9BACI
MGTIAVWFRKDLRLNDQTALSQALQTLDKNDQILAVFHIHPALTENFSIRHDYFFQTLRTFVEACNKAGMPVHFINGSLEEGFTHLTSEVEDLEAIYFNEDEVGYGKKRDEEAMKWLDDHEVPYRTFIDHHIHGAGEIKKADGDPYLVFTPYFKKWKTRKKPSIQKVDHQKLKKQGADLTEAFKDGYDTYQKMLKKCTHDWKALGETCAMERLKQFIDERIYDYEKKRDFPALNGTSRLSPYLKTGALSPRTIYHQIGEEVDHRKNLEGVDTFVSELAWRDFYSMVYHYHPDCKDKEIIEKYRGLDWNTDEAMFEKWKDGQTGFPLIDAAMTQLNERGWMHNRLRMATASFLTKDLLMDWRKGERYFEEKLIDYDPASNIGGWQWAASTGTDAVPYFRVFNPVRQSERFDPKGAFIKRYLPALEKVPEAYIHEPWKMSDEEQREAECIIGEDYPKPMVDHKTMRKRAIEMFKGES